MNPQGILLINLGTPNAPTPRALRPYLKEFLGDPFVDLGLPRFAWWLVLHLIVLPFRPRKSAAMYKKVWTKEGAPLTVNSRKQVEALQKELGDGYKVAFGYRYGEPSIETTLRQLADAGCKRVTVLPLFPQDTSAGYQTAVKQLHAVLNEWRGGTRPEIKIVAPFYDDPGYIRSLASIIEDAEAGRTIDHLVFSYHGVPQVFVDRGEPYAEHCEATSRALAKELGLHDQDWTLAYQSRFGRSQWLTPATADVLEQLGTKYKRILVATPGFPADCLETIEEIGMLGADSFRQKGGEELILSPCLNDSPQWVAAMADMVR